MAAAVRHGEQLDHAAADSRWSLRQLPPPPKPPSAAALRAQDPEDDKAPCRSLKECKKKRKRSRRTSPSVEKAAASANATGRTSSSSKTVAASANTEGRGRSQPRSLQKRHRSCTPGPFHRRSRANKETAEKVESEDAPRSKTATMREPNFCDSDRSVSVREGCIRPGLRNTVDPREPQRQKSIATSFGGGHLAFSMWRPLDSSDHPS